MMKIEQARPEMGPDPAGIVRRADAVEFRGYVERFGEPPACFVGVEREGKLAPPACKNPAVMEVYGVPMCEAHGEEAAAGALLEIAPDLEQELQRPMNGFVRSLSPHLEAALHHGFEVLSDEAKSAEDRSDALLLAAFPLDRGRTDYESIAYAADPDANGRMTREPPSERFRNARLILHRHMRLAFEEGADWLVEMLEAERESVAAPVAYTLALEREAGLP